MYVKPHRRAAKPRSRKKHPERRIVIELVSAADVARLEARDDAVKAEQTRIADELNRRVDGLHHQLYEVIDALGRLRTKK